ncbi:hypothetical protein E4U57_003068 [Claviceps arundinis]|uniref:RRP14-involved in ribosomal RNA processing n=1 Tax=Claviceps arundinis TaxID=1623583 RepID=A0ABQ7P7L4_9HYPO|nr:hypothetical protein E4U57_003068 [Claviceps arundinis]
MAESSLKDRLRDHAKAFDGLLSLIPAKLYYGEDTSNQWNRKKQTKQEAAAARRGKLDPDSELNRNAKEVMDERAQHKRKLRELEEQENAENDGGDGDSVSDDSYEAMEGVEPERPGDGLKKKTEDSNKKQKLMTDEVDQTEVPPETVEDTVRLSKKEAKREAKREKKNEKKAEKKIEKRTEEKSEEKTEKKADKKADKISDKKAEKKAEKKAHKPEHNSIKVEATEKDDANSDIKIDESDEAAPLSVHAKMETATGESASESEPQSPVFDKVSEPVAETTAEHSSTTPSPSSPDKPKQIKIPADSSEVRARVAARIEALRAARNAKRPQSRQQLLEERRTKQAQRAERKKEEKKKARQEAARLREEALASNSPDVTSPTVELEDPAGKFSFGRVAFADGTQMSHDLSYVLTKGKKKGPSDVKTALLKVQNQKKRLEEMAPEKRAEISEKEVWLTARRKAEGEKVHDSEARLKKAKNRKEAAERKSKKEWKERASGVGLAQKERQKKREENIKKRREDKLLGKAGKKKGGAKKKKGGRPGFEGSFGGRK